MKNILVDFQKELENNIKIYRRKHFEKLGISEQKLEETFSKGLLYSEECKNLGFQKN